MRTHVGSRGHKHCAPGVLNSFDFLTPRLPDPRCFPRAFAGAEIFVIHVYAASLYSCVICRHFMCLPSRAINLRPRLAKRPVNLGRENRKIPRRLSRRGILQPRDCRVSRRAVSLIICTRARMRRFSYSADQRRRVSASIAPSISRKSPIYLLDILLRHNFSLAFSGFSVINRRHR